MKHAPTIAGGLLGLLFIVFSLFFFLKIGPTPPPPVEGSPAALFMGAFYPTGYLAFVKALELLGGILTAIPRTRNWGLLILGPILVNILAYHVFVLKGAALLDPVLIVITLLAAYLLWAGRREFIGLLKPARSAV